MHDSLEALEGLRRHLTQVHAEGRDLHRVGDEVAPLVEERVETRDIVAGLDQHRARHRPDVAVVPGDEDLHKSSAVPRVSGRGRKTCS